MRKRTVKLSNKEQSLGKVSLKKAKCVILKEFMFQQCIFFS